MPVVRDVAQFDTRSGNRLERIVFNHRAWFVALCLLFTMLLGWSASRLTIDASFDAMLPQGHPYIRHYLANRGELRGLGNTLRVVVEAKQGTVYDAAYLKDLARINDAIFLLPGVDRPWMKSLWSPIVRWTEVTEEGFGGGAVIEDSYDGSPEAVERVKRNAERAGLLGSLVANDERSSMIVVPLLESNAPDGKAFDYGRFGRQFEEKVRALDTERVHVRVIGFAQLIADLLAGLVKVMTFFAAAALIAAGVIYLYTRCVRSALVVVLCSVIAVVWQLGLVALFGFKLDPYSVLVPFLVFAIGVSHGAQKMNGIMQDIARGTHRVVAARYTFRRLFLAGLTALLADAVGFAVLMLIDIPAIRDLAMTASFGVAVLIFTNLLLLPVLLSYIGVGRAAAERALRAEQRQADARSGLGRLWSLLDHLTERRWATRVLALAAVVTGLGFVVSLGLKVGDLNDGAPELRADSRYNLDNAYITSHYGLSSDVFAVTVKGPKDSCGRFEDLIEMDRLGQALSQLTEVQATVSIADSMRRFAQGGFEGNPRWWTISRDQSILNSQLNVLQGWNTDLTNLQCSVSPVLAYLKDHRADTLDKVVAVASAFAAQHATPEREFLLAAGSAGIEAATNIVVKDANRRMLWYVYAAVTLLCWITFRSWRAVVVAIVPLVVTSVLAEALMVLLGMGVKVATLPVIALGVGIGVDYALYLLSVQLALQRAGQPLSQAYRHAVAFTGKVVALVGVTLAAGVVTWAWSPIKFQADMGLLLTFMFIWNMVGALVLIPALSHFLLQPRSARAVGAGVKAVPEVAVAR